MKKMLLSGLALAIIANIVVAAEGRSIRFASPAPTSPTLLGQVSDIPLPPPLSPVPDPAFTQSNPVYTPSGSTPTPSSNPYTTNYVPGPNDPTLAVPSPSYGVVTQPVELFKDVRYRGTRNISPCAVPMVIQVPDPCNRDKCCKTCVNVQVCVPPCDPQCVKVTRDGNRVLYDFGKYEVVVKTVGNHVVVHYGD